MRQKLAAMSAMVLMLASSALAESDHDGGEHRQADAHVHGESVLKMVIEGDEIAMELDAPGMDIVGFEYEAQSDEDREAVEVAIEQLSDADALFVFNEEAECELSEADAHLGDDEHEDDEHEDDHDEEVHSSFHAEYIYECQDMDALSSVEFGFFDMFENAEHVEMQIVSENGAGVVELSRDNNLAELN